MDDKTEQLNILKSISLGKSVDLSYIKDINDYVFSMEYLSVNGGFNFFMELVSRKNNFDKLILDIVKNNITSNDLLNNIANDIHTPIKVLEILAKNPSTSISSHAQLAILRKELDKGLSELELQHILKEETNDYGINIGIRSQIANHLKTPKAILLKLLKDDVDFISEAASKTMKLK